MIKNSFYLALLLLFLPSCSTPPAPAVQYQFHEDGRYKPKVALFNVIDHSDCPYDWDLSSELSQNLFAKLSQSGNLYLIPEDKLDWENSQPISETTLIRDHMALTEHHPHVEFIGLVELIEHNLTEKDKSNNRLRTNSQSYALNVKARIKVIDMRFDLPKVILQEIVEHSTYIPWQVGKVEVGSKAVKPSGFSLSPLGLAHAKIVNNIASRIEDYILIAQSRNY